jgi:RNA polymerase sigma-70 factor (ECF subfamily)
MERKLTSDNVKMAEFIKLLTANQSHIYAYILSRVLRSADADDLLQETTSTMWNKFDQFKSGTDFLSWGFTIARYNILNYRKKNKKQPMILDEDVLSRIESLQVDNSKSSQRIDALKSCMKLLPGNSSNLIQMRYSDGIDVKNIALRLNRSVPWVYKVLTKVQLILMRCINRRLAQGSIA